MIGYIDVDLCTSSTVRCQCQGDSNSNHPTSGYAVRPEPDQITYIEYCKKLEIRAYEHLRQILLHDIRTDISTRADKKREQ